MSISWVFTDEDPRLRETQGRASGSGGASV